MHLRWVIRNTSTVFLVEVRTNVRGRHSLTEFVSPRGPAPFPRKPPIALSACRGPCRSHPLKAGINEPHPSSLRGRPSTCDCLITQRRGARPASLATSLDTLGARCSVLGARCSVLGTRRRCPIFQLFSRGQVPGAGRWTALQPRLPRAVAINGFGPDVFATSRDVRPSRLTPL
jgi:hypothetical protein